LTVTAATPLQTTEAQAMRNSVQRGDILDLDAGVAVTAGQGFLFGDSLFGIAIIDAKPGVKSAFAINGVAQIAKAPALAIACGDRLRRSPVLGRGQSLGQQDRWWLAGRYCNRGCGGIGCDGCHAAGTGASPGVRWGHPSAKQARHERAFFIDSQRPLFGAPMKVVSRSPRNETASTER